MPPPPAPSIDTLLTHFTTTHHLHPRPSWLSSTLSTSRVPPGPALLASLKFRILASDITLSLQPHANLCFPPDAYNLDASLTLAGPIAAQVVGVEEIGVAKVELLDRVEMVERGEMVRGREVIRVVAEEDGGAGVGAGEGGRGGNKGVCKVLLEDAGGGRVYAVELRPVDGVKGDMAMGTKVVLRNITVARGLLLLTPENTIVLGGKIEGLNQEWIAGRKERLKAAIEKVASAELS